MISKINRSYRYSCARSGKLQFLVSAAAMNTLIHVKKKVTHSCPAFNIAFNLTFYIMFTK